MFGTVKYYIFTCISVLVLHVEKCTLEPQPAYLVLYSHGDTEYMDVIVRREHENLTLVCEVRGDVTPRVFVWNYVGDGNGTGGGRSFTPESTAETAGSRIEKTDLQLSDSGHYMCSAPPFSITKYILVQPPGPSHCARGAFWCGNHCVLPTYVCDGLPDCLNGEDEALPLCAPNPCAAANKLNCSLGRCVSEAACCGWRGGRGALCRQPACCDEHPRYSQDGEYYNHGLYEIESPPLYEDRHAPDDYGFIQSTIYTVTACALIFMIAVVLLVSALCKMHMKRAALRGYAHAHRDARTYTARFPPRYEATRLMEPGVPPSPMRSIQLSSPGAPASPRSVPATCSSPGPPATSAPASAAVRPLAALAALCSRYRQVPTQCCEVEMTDFSLPRPSLDPSEPPSRPLTLQLGRFHFNIPRFRNERPDTPDIAEINIEDLEFVRVHSNETYTLNGRTIRLFGGSFENYSLLNRPPPYNEAMRHKFGPPPEYLSNEVLNNDSDDENSNIEMPPCYEDLASGLSSNTYQPTDDSTLFDDTRGNLTNNTTNVTNLISQTEQAEDINDNTRDSASYISVLNYTSGDNNGNDLTCPVVNLSQVIDNLPAIDDINANDSIYDNACVN